MSEVTDKTVKNVKKEVTTVPYDTQPAGLERWVDNTFRRKIPFQFPENFRTWLADNSWWLVLVGGILTLWGAWSAWQAAHYVSQLTNWANNLAASYGGPVVSPSLSVFWYLALAGLIAQAVLYLLAFRPLKEHKKSGWNLLFYSSLINLAIGVLYLFDTQYYGFGSFIGMLLGSAVGWYVLFQIREKFAN